MLPLKGLPEDVKGALVKALDDAINSDSVKEALHNSMQATAHNLGPKGTHDMMNQGAVDIKTLVDAAKTE